MQIFIFREDPLAAVFFVEAESPPSESPLKGSGLSWTTRESWKRVVFLSCWCLDWLKLAYLINKRDGEALFSSIYSNCSNHLVEMVYPFGDLSWQLSVIKGKWHNLQMLISQVWFRKGTVQSVHSIPCLSPHSRSVFWSDFARCWQYIWVVQAFGSTMTRIFTSFLFVKTLGAAAKTSFDPLQRGCLSNFRPPWWSSISYQPLKVKGKNNEHIGRPRNA